MAKQPSVMDEARRLAKAHIKAEMIAKNPELGLPSIEAQCNDAFEQWNDGLINDTEFCVACIRATMRWVEARMALTLAK